MTSHQSSILAVATVTQGVAIGLSYGIFPILLQPLEEAFDAPRTVVSAGQILITVALVAGGVIAGTAFDRGHARRVMLFGSLLLSGALVFGMLADRFRLTTLFLVMLGGMASIFAAFAIGVSSEVVAVLSVCFGFFFGAFLPVFMMLLGQQMGPLVLGRAMALSNLLMLPVMAASVLFSAAVYEEDGNYDRAVLVLTIGMLVAIGCVYGSSRASAASRESAE